MVSRRRFLAGGLTGAAVAGFAAGCGSSGGTGGSGNTGAEGEYTPPDADAQGNLTIANWGNPEDEDLYQAAIDRFNEKYPNVSVTNNFTQVVNWSDYINKMLTSIASGDAPDVINMATEGFEFGLSKDLFQPLTNYIDQDEQVQALLDDIDDNLVDGFARDGETYLLPINWNAMVTYYNKQMFEEAGLERPQDDWTWEDFRAACEQLTTGSGSNRIYGFGLQTYTFAYYPWLYTNGGSIASDDLTEPTLDSAQTIEAIEFLQDLVDEGFAPDPTGAEANQQFQAGLIAMTAAPANLSSILVQDPPNFDFGIVPMPQNTEKSTVFGAAGFAVYRQSQNQDLAWELLKELAGQETQAGWAELGSSNPTTRTAATSETFLGRHPDASVLYDAIEYAKPVAAPPFFTTLEASFQRALQSVQSGADATTELTNAQSEVEDEITNE